MRINDKNKTNIYIYYFSFIHCDPSPIFFFRYLSAEMFKNAQCRLIPIIIVHYF